MSCRFATYIAGVGWAAQTVVVVVAAVVVAAAAAAAAVDPYGIFLCLRRAYRTAHRAALRAVDSASELQTTNCLRLAQTVKVPVR